MRFYLFIPLILLACSQPEKPPSITGEWSMYHVIQQGEDVTSEHDPHDERYVIMHADSTFNSGGRPFGENSGKYSFDAEAMTLFLDSDAGPEDDSHWKVTLSGDTMFWDGTGSVWAEGFRIVNTRR
ncbi:MAG: hypothetical protein MK081_07635 [Flavobacteriales bacterium]|nr:hypothetical protein [Flavobacteriales bacterium]